MNEDLSSNSFSHLLFKVFNLSIVTNSDLKASKIGKLDIPLVELHPVLKYKTCKQSYYVCIQIHDFPTRVGHSDFFLWYFGFGYIEMNLKLNRRIFGYIRIQIGAHRRFSFEPHPNVH